MLLAQLVLASGRPAEPTLSIRAYPACAEDTRGCAALLARLLSPAAGTVALQRCDDDMRLLRLEVAELQRRLSTTHKAAPDVASHDRQIAALKADVLRARKEAEALGDALEAPRDCRDRWRVLPGKLSTREELASRVATIEERLTARKDLAVQARGAADVGTNVCWSWEPYMGAGAPAGRGSRQAHHRRRALLAASAAFRHTRRWHAPVHARGMYLLCLHAALRSALASLHQLLSFLGPARLPGPPPSIAHPAARVTRTPPPPLRRSAEGFCP